MLMTIWGVSESKAIGIVKIYPNLKSLMDSYLAKNTTKERE